MLGVTRSEPKFLAAFPGSNAGRYSVRTRIPGSISQFQCEVFVGQDQKFLAIFPVGVRGVCQSEPKALSVRTKSPEGFEILLLRRFFPPLDFVSGFAQVFGQNLPVALPFFPGLRLPYFRFFGYFIWLFLVFSFSS